MRYVNACKWLDKSMTVLDAACGTGYGTEILSKHCHSITGVDLNIEALREARKNYKHLFLEADILKTSLGGKDAIVSIETVEHFDRRDGRKLLQNFYGWLMPKGVLVISTPYCEVSGPSPITKQHLWEYSLTDFEKAISEAGFKIETIEVERNEGQAGRLGYCMVKAVR